MIDDGNLTPPLGILTMASIMEKEGWEVRFFDERIDSDILSDITGFKPNIVGISAVTTSVLRGRQLATDIKNALPDVVTVFGGPHPTAMPEEVLGWDPVDFVVVGEGEYALRDLGQWIIAGMDSLELANIPNLCYKTDKGIIKNPIRASLKPEELDMLPRPAFHILNLEQIFRNTRHGLFQKGKRVLPVMGSRGCPNRCTFCCRVMGFKIRYRDTKLLIEEIETMVSDYAMDEVYFEDDNFTVNRQRAIAFLDSFIERNLGIYIKFANGIRADAVDAEVLEKMKKAGCYSISFGIESGSPRVIEMMRKNLSLEKAKENVKIAKSMGLLVGANCIIGYPGETVADIEESLDYFMNLDLDSMAVVNLIPFPGTEVRRICEEKGYLTPEAKNWNNYIFDINNPKILIETEFISSEYLLNKINQTYRNIYLNPKRVFRLLKHMKPRDIISGAKLMLTKIVPSVNK
jgi:radical SAM superfamily enzyme YgiQ (UPF0313 family)